MPQKIDIHGLFIDPENITELYLQKRISVFYPVFYEVAPARQITKLIFGRSVPSYKHTLRFDHHEPFGIILADAEQVNPSGYIVEYHQAAIERFLRGLGRTGKNITGHITELLKMEVSGDRQYRILQSGRNIKQISIREIPAKARLISGQWLDVFQSTPELDFQGGSPYAVTDVGASALTIVMKDRCYVLYGAGVDVSNEEVLTAYHTLTNLYNEIQARRDSAKAEHARKPLVQMPQINVQLPKVELPKLELPQIKFQSPFVLGKKEQRTKSDDSSEK